MKKKLPIILSLLLVLGFSTFAAWRLVSFNNQDPKNNGNEDQNKMPAGSVLSANLGTEIYNDLNFGFTFNKPEGFSIDAYQQGEGQAIWIVSADGKGVIQALVTPFELAGIEINKEYINAQFPGVLVQNERVVLIGGFRGLFFESNNQAFGGDNIEAWFISGNNLYQISGFKQNGSQIEQLMSSWRFN